jgi:hexokinase
VEGSTFWKLTGFKERFCEELTALLAPRDMDFEILRSENACLVGAALAAFAPTM